MKEREKLTVDPQGNLVGTGVKEINLDDISELQSIEYTPIERELVVQPLTAKEVKTGSGIFLPENKKELRAAIVAVDEEETKLKRGMVIRLDGNMFGQGVPVDYICGKPVLQIPRYFVRGIYKGIDLSNWKKED